MITLQTLPGNQGAKQTRHRVGRGHGSGSGRTAARGAKGAQARAGYKRRPGFEGGQMPLHRRLPKRGFQNPFRVKTEIVNLAALDARFADGATVEIAELAALRLIADPAARVKILGDGALTKRLTVKAHAFSAKARAAIEACGGTCEVLTPAANA